MRQIMFNGRVPNRPASQHPVASQVSDLLPHQQPLSPQQARSLILEQRSWSGMRVAGHLNLSAEELTRLPENLTCESLDISDCTNLTALPHGLHVTYWIEVAGSGITSLPAGHGFVLHWRGVPVSDQIAFGQAVTGQDILNTRNVELRRVLLERLGYETFLQQVGGLVRDRDAGGRQLIYVPFDDDEPLMVLKVICPSTGHVHLLRVPPYMQSCHQAAAWIAGFNNPDDYQPLIET